MCLVLFVMFAVVFVLLACCALCRVLFALVTLLYACCRLAFVFGVVAADVVFLCSVVARVDCLFSCSCSCSVLRCSVGLSVFLLLPVFTSELLFILLLL